MTFIELPSLVDGDPHEIGFLQDMPQGSNGTLQQRGMGNIGLDSFRLDQLTSLYDFLVSFGTQGAVVPSREFVLKIPSRFSVSDQHQRVLVGSLLADQKTARYSLEIIIIEYYNNIVKISK
jgi:hypothetical protein